MRPVLKPTLRRVWRDAHTLQLGVEPGTGIVLTDVAPPVARLLELMDGTRDVPGLIGAAAAHGLDATHARQVLDLLDGAGALEDAASGAAALGRLPLTERERLAPEVAALSLARPDGLAALAARSRAHVQVHGAGRLGAAVTTLVAASGVGAVSVVDPRAARPADACPAGLRITDIGRSRADAARDLLARVAPSATTDAAGTPDVAVLADEDGSWPIGALMRDGIPHLYIAAREATARIGPFVLPARSACRRCIDLARTDRDPAWPHVAAQLARPPAGVEACGVVLAHLAAGLAAQEVLAFLDGRSPDTVDGTLDVASGGWRIRRRSWQRHPACDCSWAESA